MEQRKSQSIEPTEEGKGILTNGSYEYNIAQAIPVDTGLPQAEVMVSISHSFVNDTIIVYEDSRKNSEID